MQKLRWLFGRRLGLFQKLDGGVARLRSRFICANLSAATVAMLPPRSVLISGLRRVRFKGGLGKRLHAPHTNDSTHNRSECQVLSNQIVF